MTKNQVRQVELGTKVFWEEDILDIGIVVDKNQSNLFIKWEDGERTWISEHIEKVHKL